MLDKRSKTWNFFYWENGKRRSKKIGATSQFPTKASAWRAAKPLRDAVENQTRVTGMAPSVRVLVEQYRVEKMPERYSTRYGYNAWLDNYVLPAWGEHSIVNLQARPVDLWLRSLDLAPKSKVAIRGLLSILWDFAMWRGDVPTQRNPMQLVAIKGATKRTRRPRSLTADEFRRFIQHLDEPFRTMALLCVCFGLRISEALALKWKDVDWLNGVLHVERGIVRQQVGDVKTESSRKQMSMDGRLLDVLQRWKQVTQFSDPDDWVFASPVRFGQLPWSYPSVWRIFQMAAMKAGIGKVSTHTMRHTYRSWLDAVGTTIAVQQKLMRHSDVRTTMNTYGDVVTDELAEASSKVAAIALSGR